MNKYEKKISNIEKHAELNILVDFGNRWTWNDCWRSIFQKRKFCIEKLMQNSFT